jgi:CPA1 family monovalent cation:H+ antiporter
VLPDRQLLLFITAGVIMFTLVAGITLLPVVADPAGVMKSANVLRYKIISESLEQLTRQVPPPETAVIINMKKRLDDLEFYEYTPAEKHRCNSFKKRVFAAEMRALEAAAKQARVSKKTYIGAKRTLYFMYRQSLIGVSAGYALWSARMAIIERKEWKGTETLTKEDVLELMDALRGLAGVAREYIESKRGRYPEAMAALLARERENMSERMELRLLERFADPSDAESANLKYGVSMLQAFYVERGVIHRFFTGGEITREEANEMRLVVNSLESYILTGIGHDMEREGGSPDGIWQAEPEEGGGESL